MCVCTVTKNCILFMSQYPDATPEARVASQPARTHDLTVARDRGSRLPYQ